MWKDSLTYKQKQIHNEYKGEQNFLSSLVCGFSACVNPSMSERWSSCGSCWKTMSRLSIFSSPHSPQVSALVCNKKNCLPDSILLVSNICTGWRYYYKKIGMSRNQPRIPTWYPSRIVPRAVRRLDCGIYKIFAILCIHYDALRTINSFNNHIRNDVFS